MNRFHVFVGDNYYPIGGIGDYNCSFSSYEDAKAFIDGTEPRRYGGWWEIIESTEDGLVSTDSGFWEAQ